MYDCVSHSTAYPSFSMFLLCRTVSKRRDEICFFLLVCWFAVHCINNFKFTMDVQKWLVIKSNGSTKLATKYPRLGANEIAFQLHLDIPDKIFHRPMVIAKLKIPDETI